MSWGRAHESIHYIEIDTIYSATYHVKYLVDGFKIYYIPIILKYIMHKGIQ